MQDDRLAVQPQYSLFLQQAVGSSSSKAVTQVGGGVYRRLPLRVQRSGFLSDEATGTLAVPVSASIAEVRFYVQARLLNLGEPVLSASLSKGIGCHIDQKVQLASRMQDYAIETALLYRLRAQRSGQAQIDVCFSTHSDRPFYCRRSEAAVMQANGPAVLRAAQVRLKQQSELKRLQELLRKQLRLRRISVDGSLPPRQAESCLQRLLHHGDALATAADGLSLRISHVNAIAPDGTFVDIAWNFQL